MRRRNLFITAAATGATLAIIKATSAQPTRKARIGWLTIAMHPMIEPFREAMRDLRYVEGENLIIEYRYADGRAERLLGLAADLETRGDVDVIVASGGGAVIAVRGAVKTVPVVAVAADLAQIASTAGLGRPTGNITGISLLYESVSAKWLELAQQLLPSIRRVGVLLEEANPASDAQFKSVQAAARALDVSLVPLPVRSSDHDIGSAFEVARQESVGAIIVLSSAFFAAETGRIVALAARSGVPVVYEHRDFVTAGGLMSYGPDLREVFRRAASYVGKILEGARPSELPIEQPTKFEFVVNSVTARTLGITLPPSLLARADEVIE